LAANVPFGFQAGGVNFPAGEYTVAKVLPNVVRVASIDRKLCATTVANTTYKVTGSEQAKLVFNRYGDKYFLSRIWPPGNTGGQLVPGAAEREILRAATRPIQHILLAEKMK
jgi:hypothetical protein